MGITIGIELVSCIDYEIRIKIFNEEWKSREEIIQFKDIKDYENLKQVFQSRTRKIIFKEQEHQQINAPDKSGWLKKKSEIRKIVKIKWFELQEGVLRYNSNQIKVRGSQIILTQIHNLKNNFSIYSEGHIYHLEAPNIHEKYAWISACIKHGAKLERQ